MSHSIKQFYVVGRPLDNPKADEEIIAQGGEMAKVAEVMTDELMETIDAKYGKIRIVEGRLYESQLHWTNGRIDLNPRQSGRFSSREKSQTVQINAKH